MTAMEKRLAIQDDYISQLRAAAEDPGLNSEWKLVVIRGIFKELDAALAALKEETE